MMAFLGIICVFVLVVALSLWPVAPFWLWMRDYLRSSPAGRRAWSGNGGWLVFSRRFGLPYALALVLAGFGWLTFFIKRIPDTDAGVWFLIAPTLTLLFLGIVLGMLRLARWLVEP